MSGEAVFIVVSILLIAAYTAYNIWTVRKSQKLYKELQRLIEEQKREET